MIGYHALFAGIMYVATGLRLRGVHEKLQPLEKAISGSQPKTTNPSAAAGS